jgi:tetratricopeptide (TPR) repeat protein
MAGRDARAKESESDAPGVTRAAAWLFPLLVFLAALASFAACWNHEFVALDDDANFQLNYRWRGLGREQLSWLWNETHYGHWHPLTWLTFCAEYEWWGEGADGQPLAAPLHRTNLVLHALGALAFYFLALELLRWIGRFASAGRAFAAPNASQSFALRACALLAALTWALHPLRVESVAWVTERRDLLSGLFLSLTVLAYLRGVRHGASRLWLALALAMYLASLLSKAWGITLPVVLLALDVYPLRRTPAASDGAVGWNRLVVEKLAFGAVALWAAVEAKAAQADIGAVMSLAEHGILARAAQASYGLCFYVLKTLWPADLSCHYLLEVDFRWDTPIHVAAMGVVLVVTIALLTLRKRAPAAFATWFLYGVLVSPVLGILQSGAQKVADRYSYIAAMPFSIALAAAALVWTLRAQEAQLRSRAWRCAGLAGLFALVLAPLAWRQTKLWANSETLFRQAFEVQPDNYFIAHNLAVTLYRRQAYSDALEVEKASVAAHPGYGNHQARYTLGLLYKLVNQPDLAEQAFRETVEIAPDNSAALREVRSSLMRRGDREGVVALYEHALEVGERNRREDRRRPVLTEAYGELAALHVQRGEFDKARAVWERARDAGAPPALAENGIGKTFLAQGRFDEAETRLVRAQQYDPRNIELMVDVCELFVRQNRAQDALANLDKVLAVDPNHARATALRQQAQARLAPR